MENSPGVRKRNTPGRSAAAKNGVPPENTQSAPPTLRRFRPGFRWDHVELEPYKLSAHKRGEFLGASRQVLVGKRGERVKFHVRYFELDAGGYTSLERHRHSHVVIGVTGRGRVRVGNDEYPLSPLDTIYIGPEQSHQLRTVGRSKFGFLCIVDSVRDKPRPVSDRQARSAPARK